jgi:hypothetical protein
VPWQKVHHLRNDRRVCAVDGGFRGHFHVALCRKLGLGGARHALIVRRSRELADPYPPAGLSVHASLGLDRSRPPVRRDARLRPLKQGVDLLGRGRWCPARSV